MDEMLFPFVAVEFAGEESGVALCASGTVVRMDQLIPIAQVAQLRFRVAQHFLKGAVGKGAAVGDAEETDADLGMVEDGAEELSVRLQAGVLLIGHNSPSLLT